MKGRGDASTEIQYGIPTEITYFAFKVMPEYGNEARRFWKRTEEKIK